MGSVLYHLHATTRTVEGLVLELAQTQSTMAHAEGDYANARAALTKAEDEVCRRVCGIWVLERLSRKVEAQS